MHLFLHLLRALHLLSKGHVDSDRTCVSFRRRSLLS